MCYCRSADVCLCLCQSQVFSFTTQASSCHDTHAHPTPNIHAQIHTLSALLLHINLCPSVHLPVCLSICLLSLCLSACFSAYLSVNMSVLLCVCVSDRLLQTHKPARSREL